MSDFSSLSTDTFQDEKNQEVLLKAIDAANAVLKENGLEMSEMTAKRTNVDGEVGAFLRVCGSVGPVKVCVD